MDVIFHNHRAQMDQHLALGHTTEYWYCWSWCVEQAYIEARQLTAAQAEAVRGRGHVLFETAALQAEVQYAREEDAAEWTQIYQQDAEGPLRASRMLRQLSNLARKHPQGAAWSAEMRELWNAILRRHRKDLPAEASHDIPAASTCCRLVLKLESTIIQMNKTVLAVRRKIATGKAEKAATSS